MRQWGEPGTPPFGGCRVRWTGLRGKWIQAAREFTLRLANTQRGDIKVSIGSPPDKARSPAVYVDDVKLEVLAGPTVAAELLAGTILFSPDTRLPLRVNVTPSAWKMGLRHLRWDVTTPDGLSSHSHGEAVLAQPLSVLEAAAPTLVEGPYAVRMALGRQSGERKHELLLPFRAASGPFGH